jgi:N-acylneuraminate cytidylyltransferase
VIGGKRILGIIPARGGSKGIPRKNIHNLAGRPLIAWTIDEAKKSKYIDRLILSSEDEEIIKIAREWECEVPFVRPWELAQDDTQGMEPVIHAIKVLPANYDYIVELQPTSPLRTAEDIDACIEKCIYYSAPACISVCEAAHSPYWMYTIDEHDRMKPCLPEQNSAERRQDLPIVYQLNGAVYVARAEYLLKNETFMGKNTIVYIMPQERSIDIDNMLDLLLCEYLINHRI